MSSSTTPASDARAFVRGQRFALATLESSDREEIVRVAFSASGCVLLGNDVPPVARQFEPTQLLIGTNDCFAAIEGQVASHFDEADRRRFEKLHPGFELRWILEPDVVIWHSAEDGAHAFLAAEWLLDELGDEDAASALVDHVNRHHRAALEALVEELTGRPGSAALLVDLDVEGLLFETRDALYHVHYDAICPAALGVEDALLRLVRNMKWVAPDRSAAIVAGSAQAEPYIDARVSSSGGRFGSAVVRSEGHFGHHGYSQPNPPWRRFSLRDREK